MNFNEAAILFALNFAHQPALDGALDHSHHGVVASLHEFGEFGNGGPAAARVARHSQQELVLLGSDATRPRYALAEVEKTAQPVAKPRQTPDRFGP